MFDFTSERIDTGKFNEAKKKITDYVGAKYGRNNHIFENYEDFEFEEPAEPEADELSLENDPIGSIRRAYEKRLVRTSKEKRHIRTIKPMFIPSSGVNAVLP